MRNHLLTPPAEEHIMSVAIPQQWSLEPGHAQSRMQPISRTLLGFPATIAFAPSTAILLHAPTLGKCGAGKPPGLLDGTQHLKSAGPGHSPVTVL